MRNGETAKLCIHGLNCLGSAGQAFVVASIILTENAPVVYEDEMKNFSLRKPIYVAVLSAKNAKG